MTTTREDLWAMDVRGLTSALQSGFELDPEALVGCDYRGVSLGLPRVVERLTWKVFRKVFRRAADGGVIGHNVRLEQTGLWGPSIPRKRGGHEMRFGPYRVVPLPASGTPFGLRSGIVLDYGREHPRLHPLSLVRDPVVAVNDGSTELLLGATYLELFSGGVRTPSFFTLERETTSAGPFA